MKNGKQKLSFLLALLCCSSAMMGACGSAENGKKAETTTASAGVQNPETTAETAETTDERLSVSDGVPELDFGGAEFRTITQDSTVDDIWVEGETGDVLDDAVYARNRAIEERFNIKFDKATAVGFGEISAYIKKTVNAGDDAYDLIIGQMEQTGQDALGGYFMNWYDLPYVDFTKPWYPTSLVKQATINDKMFVIASDLCLSYVEYTYCVYFDKTTASNYDLPDLYQMVKDGKWTIDKMIELTKDVYQDTDGSNDRSDGDYYGMYAILDACTVAAYFYGMDLPYVRISDGNEITDNINTDKMDQAVTKLKQAFFQTDGIRSETAGTTKTAAEKFVTGNYLFSPSILKYSLYDLRQSKNEYGILPFPKWDEAQENYESAIDAGCSVLSVPTTAKNTEMIGAVVEALSAESWKTVMPVFYNTVMESKVANDAGTVEMLDMIFNSRVIDFAYLYDGWKGWVFSFPAILTDKKDLASFYASKQKPMTRHYNEVLSMFMEES